MSTYAEGANYTVDLSLGLAVCTVWKRTDLSREDGMRCAEEQLRVFERLGAESRLVVRAAILDLSTAPATWGPVTQGCLEKIFALFERVERRIAAVVGDDAIQGLQLRRIVTTHASVFGGVFPSLDEAKRGLRDRASSQDIPDAAVVETPVVTCRAAS